MPDGNFINLNRKILEWEWYKNEHTKTVFLHCLLKANWTDGKFEGMKIPRGSFVTSYGNMAQELGLTVKTIRVALEHLKRTGEVASTSYPKYTVITIKNYELYQYEGKDNGKQRASEGQAKGNNIKREKGKKEKIESAHSDLIDSLIEKYGADFVNERVERANYYGVSIQTLSKWCEEDAQKIKPLKKSSFNNFSARTYDFGELERKLLRKESQ